MGKLAHPLTIRGHHLLCLLGFRGRGYSPAFVESMGKVLEEFRANPDVPVILVTECDEICSSCPHMAENECRKNPDSAVRIKEKDAAILKKAGLPANKSTTPKEAWNAVKETFTPEDIAVLCSRCQWVGLGYCQEGLAKLLAFT